MNKNVLIVDCDDRQIQRIEKVVWIAAKEKNIIPKMFTANNVTDADEILQETDIDILILDTVYKGFKRGEYLGVEWVERFRETEKYMFLPVIFISSMEEPLNYAYMELKCIGFFPRKFETERLLKVLRRAMYYTTYRDDENYVVPRNYGVYYPIKVKEIVYAQVKDRLLYIHKQDGEVLEIMHMNLSQLYESSESICILQCNKSTLVNKNYVAKVDLKEKYLLLKENSTQIKIGKPYEEAIRRRFLMKNQDCVVFS